MFNKEKSANIKAIEVAVHKIEALENSINNGIEDFKTKTKSEMK